MANCRLLVDGREEDNTYIQLLFLIIYIILQAIQLYAFGSH